MLTPADLQAIKTLLSPEFKSVKKDIKKLRSDLDATIRFFDSEILDHEDRIRKIESNPSLGVIN